MNPMQQVPLPELDTIRARIDDLDEEAKLLRKLLSTVTRIKARQVKTTPTDSVYLREARSNASR